jgi:hypothetical protein
LLRFKTILLRYLLKVPDSLGFRSWSPFLEIGPSLAMLKLPPARRAGRAWQKDWFSEKGVLLEEMGLRANPQNSLDARSIRKQPPPPLDEEALSAVFRRDYVRWINSQVVTPGWSPILRSALLRTPKIKWVLRKWGLTDTQMKAYGAYLTLKPIDNLLRKASGKAAG